MIGLLILAATGGGLHVPTDLPALRAALIAGDVVTPARAELALRAEGERTDLGSLGLLADLSRLMRCLPLGPVPRGEVPPYAAARALVRLERVRLERRLRDGAHEGSDLDLLLRRPPIVRDRKADQSKEIVAWPIEDEAWPGERDETALEPSACHAPVHPALRAPEARDRRAAAEREMLVAAVAWLDALPDAAAGKVAIALLHALEPERIIPVESFPRLAEAIAGAPPPLRSAGRIALARRAERAQLAADAVTLYSAALADPSRTDAEDSRARVRLAALSEPEWDRVLALIHEARAPRAEDWAALSIAEARAHYAKGDIPALQRFGRTWLRARKERKAEGPLVAATEDVLVRAALVLPAPEAMAWTEEVGPAPTREERLAKLGQLARDAGDLDLATQVYDRLRLEATRERRSRGPRAAVELARWTAEAALIEYQREDPAAFAGFVGGLVEMAAAEAEKPLARTASHRELARVVQELLGRLTNDAARDPERRAYAGALLEAAVALARTGGRWRPVLEGYVAPLEILAGPYAAGRAPAAAPARKPRRVKSLGEVVVPRLPPLLDLPDVPTPLPAPASLLLFEAPDGTWVSGAPWALEKK